jgi:hypothetical protein
MRYDDMNLYDESSRQIETAWRAVWDLCRTLGLDPSAMENRQKTGQNMVLDFIKDLAIPETHAPNMDGNWWRYDKAGNQWIRHIADTDTDDLVARLRRHADLNRHSHLQTLVADLDKAAAALARPPATAGEVEPVAWQVREYGGEWFIPDDDDSYEGYRVRPKRFELRPLYTSPPPAATEVVIVDGKEVRSDDYPWDANPMEWWAEQKRIAAMQSSSRATKVVEARVRDNIWEAGYERGKYDAYTKTTDKFENAARHAKPDCSKCGGKGRYNYDENHSTICDSCCQHNMGWWLLEKHYGKDNGKLCCLAGCGTTRALTPHTKPAGGEAG